MEYVVRIKQHGGVEVLEYVDTVVPAPQPTEVQIRQHAIGLNFIDIYFRTGLYASPLPHGLGFEGAGIVTAVGAHVTHLKEGDRVAYGQSPLGAYATLRNTDASKVVKLPDGISFEAAAAIMLKGLTVQYLFRQTYRLTEGETIVFHAAAGGVGLIACQWAKALGVKMIGTASSHQKAELAKTLGAWEVVNYVEQDLAQEVLRLTDGQKVPVVYDGVGKSTFETSLNCLRPRGLLVSFGNASGAVEGVNLGILAQKGSLFLTRPTLGAYTSTYSETQAAADELFDMILTQKIVPQIQHRFKLSEVGQAHEALASRQTTGSIVLTV